MSDLNDESKSKEEFWKNKEDIERKIRENPEQFLEENNIDLNELKSNLENFFEKFIESVNPFLDAYNTKTFKDLNNFRNNKLKNKVKLNEHEKIKIENLSSVSFSKDFINKTQSCFIGADCDNLIIDAHSIQENGELSLISENKNVYHFSSKIGSKSKEIQVIQIKKASVFKGFCRKHDNNVFEPIDKKKAINDSEKYFLYSFRSFAFSYHNEYSFQRYSLKQINQLRSTFNSIVETAKMNDSISKLFNIYGCQDMLKKELPVITDEQKKNLEITRFEYQRRLLLNYSEQKDYDKLEYFVYEKDFICPIVCASWMITHIYTGNNYHVKSDGKTSYYGIPIIISVFPEQKKTKIVLARFKEDNSGSELVFNFWRSLFSNERQFELEISKLIIEKVENFYLSPLFWNKLSLDDQNCILNAVSINKSKFPQTPDIIETFNFFDEKYKIIV